MTSNEKVSYISLTKHNSSYMDRVLIKNNTWDLSLHKENTVKIFGPSCNQIDESIILNKNNWSFFTFWSHVRLINGDLFALYSQVLSN